MLGVLKPALMPVQGVCVVMCQTAAGSKRRGRVGGGGGVQATRPVSKPQRQDQSKKAANESFLPGFSSNQRGCGRIIPGDEHKFNTCTPLVSRGGLGASPTHR